MIRPVDIQGEGIWTRRARLQEDEVNQFLDEITVDLGEASQRASGDKRGE